MKTHIGKKVTIIVVDDHEIVRSGIVSLLAGIDSVRLLQRPLLVNLLSNLPKSLTPMLC